jgi:hypothetical protein
VRKESLSRLTYLDNVLSLCSLLLQLVDLLVRDLLGVVVVHELLVCLAGVPVHLNVLDR